MLRRTVSRVVQRCLRPYATANNERRPLTVPLPGYEKSLDVVYVENERRPLTVPLPGYEKSLDANSGRQHVGVSRSEEDPFAAELSKLDTGLRIVSQPHTGQFATIGVAIASGSRFEGDYPRGTAHFLEKLAFGDTTIFAASCHKSGVKEVLEVIADAALRPAFLDEEVSACRTTLSYENVDIRGQIQAEPLITDFIHQAAFRHNTLGFSKFTPDSSVEVITREDINRFQRVYHVPPRMVVAGVGVDHGEFTEFCRGSFVPRSDDLPSGIKIADNSLAQYTGGELRLETDLSHVGQGTPYPLLTHVAVALEGTSYLDKDFIPMCVLQSLMGGGNSFSAGGPGKGMYTRMYTDVLNHHHWMYGCQAFNHSYADAGLFAIHASCPREGAGVAVQIIVDQLLRLPQGTEKEELDRAKKQLQSQLLMNLEVRPVLFEDMARQVMGNGYRKKPDQYLADIEAVKDEDIRRVGERMLASRPSLVGYGDITALPTYDQLDEAIARRDVNLLRPKKSFSWQ